MAKYNLKAVHDWFLEKTLPYMVIGNSGKTLGEYVEEHYDMLEKQKTRVIKRFPELAEKWIEDEEEAKKNGKYGGHTYFKNTTIKELRSIAQNNLFKNYDLNNIEPSYNCKCTNF